MAKYGLLEYNFQELNYLVRCHGISCRRNIQFRVDSGFRMNEGVRLIVPWAIMIASLDS
jgi:hypothetical protein